MKFLTLELVQRKEETESFTTNDLCGFFDFCCIHTEGNVLVAIPFRFSFLALELRDFVPSLGFSSEPPPPQ